MTENRTDPENPQGHPALVHAMRSMPAWKMKLLGFGLVLGVLGAGAQVAAYFLNGPTAPVSQTAASSPGAGSGGIVAALTPFMSHFGFSLFVGILFGLVFRTFLRTALLISALILGAAYGITHLLHINIDMTEVKTDTSQAVSWLTDQGYRLKTMLFHVLPSSTAASVGFIFGFKKR